MQPRPVEVGQAQKPGPGETGWLQDVAVGEIRIVEKNRTLGRDGLKRTAS